MWQAEVAAPAGIVYGLLADAARRPLYCPSAVHVERLPGSDGVRDELQVWCVAGLLDTADTAGGAGVIEAGGAVGGRAGAEAGGGVRAVGERRVLDPARRRIDCAAGTWQVDAPAPDRARVTLAGGSAAAWHDARELLALAAHWERLDELVLTFEDSARVAAAPGATYERLAARAGQWPYRVCLPASGRIVGKRPQPADGPLAAHTGVWCVDGDGLVRVRHSVVLRPAALGAQDPGAVRASVRRELGRQSRDLLTAVRQEAERDGRRLKINVV
ncbi:hypothetical protein [Streptomyces bambusae]|uniref:Uncharacterized protein n=1 Tax=Streptomyces bambusae TaxID=1550616 RepID=A0ABS6Z0Q6_9ACTN|nr:hypothetical protein [Streptomyces bambusae]MBW5481318.1 hypothetical protein [Streptomyces bambusae]